MINPIIKFLFKGYENTLAAMATRIITVVKTTLAGQTVISPVLEKVTTSTAALNEALGRNRKGAFTDALIIDDSSRDNLYLAWVQRLESDMLCTYKPQLALNAKRLYSELVENGRILMKGYLDESNQLENLFRRYEALAPLISENGIQELYGNLVSSQKKFQETLTQSTQSLSNKKDVPWLEKASQDLMSTLNDKLFTRISNGAEDIGEPFVNAALQINEIIESIQRVQRSRIARNDKTDEPVEETVQESVSA